MSETWSECPGNFMQGQPGIGEGGVLKKQTIAMGARLCTPAQPTAGDAPVIFLLKPGAEEPVPCASVCVCIPRRLQPLLMDARYQCESVCVVAQMPKSTAAHGRVPML